MSFRFLSVCSGIEAASVAWAPLGWRAWGLSEIKPFPRAVLAHHYPHVPNLGDMNNFKDWPDATLDVLCGGTPCQSFSNAGLRAGLDDPRGQLMLTFGAIAARYRPQWLVWENVPGVLSSNEGRDFGAFLGLLGFLGYGFAYRVPSDPCHPLAAGAHPPAIAFPARMSGTQCASTEELAPTMGSANETAIAYGTKRHNTELTAVRRLMPSECEALQGFPPGYTAVWFRGKPAKDGPRYEAIGNSWPVNVARWVGWRISAVEGIGFRRGESRRDVL